MTDSAALARQLAELDKVATPGAWRWNGSLVGFENWSRRETTEDEGAANDKLIVSLRNNLPAILRALCVTAAVEERKNMICRVGCMFTGNYLSQRADELLAECTGAK